MDKNLNQLHKTLVEILDFVVSVCEENNLEYCLAYGSALGAYRHKGFIPWDDDMDIAMPRNDYEKFLRIMQSKYKDGLFRIQTEKTEKKYFLSFAKVRKQNTVFIESIAEEIYSDNGIYIDIFPLDGVFNAETFSFRIKRKYINYLKHVLKLQACPALYQKKEGQLKYYVDRILSFPNLFISNKKLLASLNKTMISKQSVSKAPYIAQYDESNAGGVMRRDVYFPFGKCEFEGKQYSVPGKIEEYLRTQYGETYMELPPEEKRATHKPIELKF